jgi:hypothetical protein
MDALRASTLAQKQITRMEYKKVYDPQELQELIKWFADHHDELPQSIYINSGTFVKDVRFTASHFHEIVAKVGEKKFYGSHMRLFFTLRERIIEQWEKEKFEREAESVPV